MVSIKTHIIHDIKDLLNLNHMVDITRTVPLVCFFCVGDVDFVNFFYQHLHFNAVFLQSVSFRVPSLFNGNKIFFVCGDRSVYFHHNCHQMKEYNGRREQNDLQCEL